MPEYAWRIAVLDADLPSTTKLVGIALAAHCTYLTGEDAYASNETIARRAGLKSRTTANRHIRALVGADWLEDTGRKSRFGTVVYRLTLPHGRGVTVESHNITPTTNRAPSAGPIVDKAADRAALNREIAAAYGCKNDEDSWADRPIEQEEHAPF